MNQVRSLTTRSAVFTIAMLLQTGISFVLIPLYTAYLTPADYGILAIAAAISGILAILYLQSIEGVFTRFYFDFTDERERQQFYGSLWLFQLAFTGACTILLSLIGRTAWVSALLPIPYYPYIHYVVLTAFVSSTAFLLPRALFLVREQTWKYTALNLSLFALTTSAVIYFVAVRREGAAGSLAGTFYATLLVGLAAMVTIVRNIRPAWRGQQIKEGLAFALPLVPHLLSLWALDLADRLILQRYVPLAEIGIYTLGYQIGSIPQIVAFAASTAIAPFYYRTADGADAKPVLSRLATYYLAFVAWAGVATVSLGPDVIALIASQPGYLDSPRVIPWVVLGSFMRGFYFIFVAALYYTKQVKALPVVTIAAALTNIVLNLLLIPRIGYMAAAIITFITFALQAALMYVFARRAFPLPYEWGRLALIAIVAVVSSAALSLFQLPNVFLDFALKTALALTFPLVLWAMRIIRFDGFRT